MPQGTSLPGTGENRVHNEGKFEKKCDKQEAIYMNRPEKKFRAGAISATIWLNEGQRKTGETAAYKTISLDRNYKDKTGAWKSTNSFRINDLPRAALVLNKAYEYLSLREPKEGSVDIVDTNIEFEDII